MKIALIDPVGAKMGMNHYNDGLMNTLAERGINVFILSNYKSGFEKINYKVFFQNINKPTLKSAWENLYGIVKSIFFCRKQKMNWVMFHIFRGGFFDLFSLALAKMTGLQIFLIVHDIETIDTTTNRFIKRIVLRYFHATMVVHNQYSMEKLKKFTGTDLKNVFVIPHGNYIHAIDTSYTRKQSLEYLKLDPSQHYLLFFGQIKESKGLDVLLKAMVHSKSNFKLIIAGKLRIKNFEPYQSIINRHKIQDRVIIMLKRVHDDEADMLFTLCDAVILPYKVIYQSGVLLLAMSYGKTIIASDLPPFKELIQYGTNGLLFENNNPRDLALKIDELVAGNFNTEELGRNAHTNAEKDFSWQKIAGEYALLLA